MKSVLETHVTGYDKSIEVRLNIYRNDTRHKTLPVIIQVDRSGWDNGIYPDENVAGLRLTQDNIDELIKTLVNVRVELENGSKK